MDRYVDIFIKAVITTITALMLGGISYSVKTLIVIQNKVEALEKEMKDNTTKTNALYYKYVKPKPEF